MADRPRRGSTLVLLLLPVAGWAQEPQLATVVEPLPVAFPVCKDRVLKALTAEGYGGFLEFGNGWSGHARGTAVSASCIGRATESVLVLVAAGGQPVREAKSLYDRILGESAPTSPTESPPPVRDSLAERYAGWKATASELPRRPGLRYSFWCPPDGSPGPVWGDREYAVESSVCGAAVHAGTLSVRGGGNAIIEIRQGRPDYGASERNGILTRARGPSAASFVVVTPEF